MRELTSIQVLVAHRVPLVQAGLAATLRAQPGIEVRSSGLDPIADHFLDGSVSVVILDFEQGLQFAETVMRAHQFGGAPCKVIVLADPISACGVRQALKFGVLGIHRLDTSGERMIQAVYSVAQGERSFDEGAMACLARSFLHQDLTQREHDVLVLLSEGACNKEVARHLRIAVGTVKTHVRSILDKMGAKTRLQAIAVATERGIDFRRSTPGTVMAPARPIAIPRRTRSALEVAAC